MQNMCNTSSSGAVTEQRIPKTENFQFDHKFSREDNNNNNKHNSCNNLHQDTTTALYCAV